MNPSRKQSRKGVVVMHPYRGCAIKLQIHRDEITWSYTDASDFETHGMEVYTDRQSAYEAAKREIDAELDGVTEQPQPEPEYSDDPVINAVCVQARAETDRICAEIDQLYAAAAEMPVPLPEVTEEQRKSAKHLESLELAPSPEDIQKYGGVSVPQPEQQQQEGALFALPFGRCLSPQPYPEKPAFKKGDLVCWAPDHEQGVVMAADEERVTVAWEESQGCTYSTSSLAARETIIVLETSDEEGGSL